MPAFSSIKKIFICFLILSACSCALKAQCKISDIVNKNKVNIAEPFIYDGFVYTQFTFDSIAKSVHIQFTALKKQQYKLHFCTSGFSETLNISVKPEKGELILLNTKAGINDAVLDVTKSGNYTIEYSVPLAENAEFGNVKHECIVMLISYKLK